MPTKKQGGGQKKKQNSNQLIQGVTVPVVPPGVVGAPPGFNQTKKNLPTLKKITDHKKSSYVSPYSFKAIQKP
jgi:hypothetical protein